MYKETILAVLLLHSAALVSARGKIHTVEVGGNSQLIYRPNTVQAAVGDKVVFRFLDKNHTVTNGDPMVGCSPKPQATPTTAQNLADFSYNSGFVPVAANQTTKLPEFVLDILSTDPSYVYCAQAQHCQSGMVMVINPADDVSSPHPP